MNIWALMTVGDWAASGIGALGLFGGVVSFFVSLSARKKARKAEADSSDALTRSAAAAERAAAALEEANLMHAESKRHAPWAVQWKGKDRVYLINWTGAIARNVSLEVTPPAEEQRFEIVARTTDTSTVEVGAALECLWHNVDQSSDQAHLTLTWADPSSGGWAKEEMLLIRP